MTARERTLIPKQPEMFVLKDPEGRELFRYAIPQTQGAPVEAEQPGTATRALKRGALHTASDFTTTAGLLAEWVGDDQLADSFYTKADEFARRAHEYQPTIAKIEDVSSVGELGTFAMEKLVENAPMLASMAVPGGIVAKSLQVAGASSKAAAAGGTAAAFLADVGLQTGESGNIAREAGASPVDTRVVGHGIGKAALDFVPLLTLAKRFGLAKGLNLNGWLEKALVGRMAQGGFLRRARRAQWCDRSSRGSHRSCSGIHEHRIEQDVQGVRREPYAGRAEPVAQRGCRSYSLWPAGYSRGDQATTRSYRPTRWFNS